MAFPPNTAAVAAPAIAAIPRLPNAFVRTLHLACGSRRAGQAARARLPAGRRRAKPAARPL